MKTMRASSLAAHRPARLPKPRATLDDVASCPVINLKPLPRAENVTDVKRWMLFSDPPAFTALALQGKKRFVKETFLALIPALLVGSPAVGKEIVMSEGDNVISSWPPSTTALIGEDSLLNMSGVRHRQIRTILNTAMGSEAVDGYLAQMQELAVSMLDRAVSVTSDIQATTSAKPLLRSYTFQVVLSLTLGESAASAAEVAQMEDHFNLWQKSLFTPFAFDCAPFPFHYAMNARKELVTCLQRHIDRIRAELDLEMRAGGSGEQLTASSSRRGCSILKALMLLDSGGDRENIVLTDAELRDNVLNILFAGFDTSASALASALFYLQKHPQVLSRIQQEQDELVAQFGPEITPEVLQKMRYLDAVVKETLRCQPPVAGAFRKAAKDFELEGHVVPKDLFISVNYGYMAATDERWQHLEGSLSPAVFNPERHLTEEGQKQGSQVVFGMGPRTCPGSVLGIAEQKVLLAVLSRGYACLADIDTTFDKSTVPSPANGLPIYVQKRPASA